MPILNSSRKLVNTIALHWQRIRQNQKRGVSLGKRTRVGKFTLLTANDGRIDIGCDCTIGSHCNLRGDGKIEIGNDVVIDSHCVLNTVARITERGDVPIREQGLACEPIRIEDDVWLGTGVTVLKGVRIGRGSVVGPGAVVTSDIPPFSIAVGVPARVTGYRDRSSIPGNLVDWRRASKRLRTYS